MEATVQKHVQKKTVRLRMKRALVQLLLFAREQALSCLFSVVIFASLALTKIVPLPFLPRYDWLLIGFQGRFFLDCRLCLKHTNASMTSFSLYQNC